MRKLHIFAEFEAYKYDLEKILNQNQELCHDYL